MTLKSIRSIIICCALTFSLPGTISKPYQLMKPETKQMGKFQLEQMNIGFPDSRMHSMYNSERNSSISNDLYNIDARDFNIPLHNITLEPKSKWHNNRFITVWILICMTMVWISCIYYIRMQYGCQSRGSTKKPTKTKRDSSPGASKTTPNSDKELSCASLANSTASKRSPTSRKKSGTTRSGQQLENLQSFYADYEHGLSANDKYHEQRSASLKTSSALPQYTMSDKKLRVVNTRSSNSNGLAMNFKSVRDQSPSRYASKTNSKNQQMVHGQIIKIAKKKSNKDRTKFSNSENNSINSKNSKEDIHRRLHMRNYIDRIRSAPTNKVRQKYRQMRKESFINNHMSNMKNAKNGNKMNFSRSRSKNR